MNQPSISVENVWKQYRKGQTGYHTLREDIYNITGRIISLGGEKKRETDAEHIWALKDVSFQIEQGEKVGIIGRNGSGKTTMLRLLAGITRPNHGKITVKGRLGVLIEIMAGFHPELSGRENVYLNGAIMGMSQKEIKRKFDEIVAFAELENFIDTPIKRYSSGMHVRLGFSVAAHLDPDILLVDEVLAVGDAAFQKKCLGKMGASAQEGRTVLFVSHNMVAVQSLCSRAIWLKDGKAIKDGQAGQVVSDYLKTVSVSSTEHVWNDMGTAPGNERVRLRRACVRPENGCASDPITILTPFVMEFECWNLEPDASLNLSLHLYDEQGILVFQTAPINEPVWYGRHFPTGLFRSVCHVPGDLLNDGMHRLRLLVASDQNLVIDQDDILTFNVYDSTERRGGYHGKIPGVIRPQLIWSTELIESH